MIKLSNEMQDEWRKKYPDFEIVRKLKSGKEADLWLVRAHGQLYALKVYVRTSLSSRADYTEGQYFRERSLRKAVKQKTKVGKDVQQRIWTKREYYLLQKLRAEGANVPSVFGHTDNAILMQYLGDETTPAPRLADIKLDDSLKQPTLAAIEACMKLFLDNGIVHADLSAYNILWWDNQPWIIDIPQAADIRHNSNWQELYARDLQNVRRYFS